MSMARVFQPLTLLLVFIPREPNLFFAPRILRLRDRMINAEDGKNLLVPIAIYASKDEPVDEVRLPFQTPSFGVERVFRL
jgi:hypothetical protein